MVEVLNENDNSPVFAKDAAQSLTINELTPVNTVVFTVQAKDADNDKIIYSIDQASPDAEYFRVDLPNSVQVILSRPLDYETKTLLTVTIHASEMNTAERFNASTNMTINIQDGDDQYPQFVPCELLFQDETSGICTSPLYTVNVTDVEEDIVLDFWPGPIHAVDGDRGLSSPLSYAIISVPNCSLGDTHPVSCTLDKAMFLCMVFMSFLGCTLSVVVWLKRKHKGKRNPLQRGCVAQGKHPNVSLRWFQLVSHRSGMPHTEKVHRNNEEFGTCNPSSSLLDNPVINTHQDLPSYRGPAPPRKDAAPDAGFTPTGTATSPVVVTDGDSTPIKCSSWSPAFHPAPVDVTLTGMAPPKEKPSDAPPDVSPGPATLDATSTPPDSRTTETTSEEEPGDPDASPSSECSVPCSHTRIASAEIDKPFPKLRAKTPPYSPLLSSLPPTQTGTPLSTPERAPLKATFVQIETSPLDTPPVTPRPSSMTLSAEPNQPSTSTDPIEGSGRPSGASDAGGPSQDRRPSTNVGNRLVIRRPGEVDDADDADDDGFLGDKDADKNNEDEDSDELDPDDEELLIVMARCNPIFITFRK